MHSNKVLQGCGSRSRKHGRRAFRFTLCLFSIVGVLYLGTAWSGGDGVPTMPGDIALRLTLFTQNGAITAGEPLIAKIELTNKSEKEVELSLGNNRHPTTYMEVRSQNGQIVACTPRPDPHADEVAFGCTLKPGDSHTKFWVISALYQFKEPGVYTVRVQQLKPSEGLPVLAEDTAMVRVTPFDAAKLEARCEEVFQPLRTGTSHRTDLPMAVRTKALYSVRYEAALPYLEWIAVEWDGQYACLAMRRIATERAISILSSLAAREDGSGKAARNALKMPLEITDVMWEMNDY